MKVSADPTVQNMFAFKHTPVAHRRRRRRSLLGATHAAHAGRVIIIIMASVAPGVPTAPGAKQARDHGQTHTHTHTHVGLAQCYVNLGNMANYTLYMQPWRREGWDTLKRARRITLIITHFIDVHAREALVR